MRSCSWWALGPLAMCVLLLSGRCARGEERILFGFEDEASVKTWSNVNVCALREAETKAAAAKPPAPVPPEPPVNDLADRVAVLEAQMAGLLGKLRSG